MCLNRILRKRLILEINGLSLEFETINLSQESTLSKIVSDSIPSAIFSDQSDGNGNGERDTCE